MCLHLKYILTRCVAPCRHMCDEWKHTLSQNIDLLPERLTDGSYITSLQTFFFSPPSNHKCSFKRKLPAQTQPFPFFCGVLTLLAFQSDVPKRAAPLSRYKRQYARINEINVIVPKERGYPVLGGSAGGCLRRCVARVSAQSQGASGRRMVLSAERSPTCCPQPTNDRFVAPIFLRCVAVAACLPACLPAPPTDGEEK